MPSLAPPGSPDRTHARTLRPLSATAMHGPAASASGALARALPEHRLATDQAGISATSQAPASASDPFRPRRYRRIRYDSDLTERETARARGQPSDPL